MEQINEREIPNFFDLENSLKADGKVDMTTFMQFLKSKATSKTRSDCFVSACSAETATLFRRQKRPLRNT